MSIEVLRTIREVRERVAAHRSAGGIIGLVPTMGALHEGHGSLMDRARGECGCVVASIFVNPIQFNQQEDYDRYPRTLATDIAFSEARGVDLIFAPSVEEMYPRPLRAFVDVEGLTEHLCGAFRPGHFRGVATVVMKLFQIVQPDRAYFGEKDAQQLAVIRRMVEDLNLPVTVVGAPIVREPSGLAMSSRNQRLSAEDRAVAATLFRSLQFAGLLIGAGARDAGEVKSQALALLASEPRIRVEYFEIVDPEEMQPVGEIAGPVRIAAAIWVGSTRLIDNVLAAPGVASAHPGAGPAEPG
jgi:pantoate--beta-alanine ligase